MGMHLSKEAGRTMIPDRAPELTGGRLLRVSNVGKPPGHESIATECVALGLRCSPACACVRAAHRYCVVAVARAARRSIGRTLAQTKHVPGVNRMDPNDPRNRCAPRGRPGMWLVAQRRARHSHLASSPGACPDPQRRPAAGRVRQGGHVPRQGVPCARPGQRADSGGPQGAGGAWRDAEAPAAAGAHTRCEWTPPLPSHAPSDPRRVAQQAHRRPHVMVMVTDPSPPVCPRSSAPLALRTSVTPSLSSTTRSR